MWPTEYPSALSEGRKEALSVLEESRQESSFPHSDSGLGDEQVPSVMNGADLELAMGGPNGMSGLFCTLSSEARSQESLIEPSTMEHLKPTSSISSISQSNKGINVKEILKSLVAAPVESTESGPDSLPYPDHQAMKREAQAMLPMQFHSFDRYCTISLLCPVF